MSSEAALQLPKGLIETSTASELETSTVEVLASHALNHGIDLRADERLLETVGNGSKEALGVLFRRHGRAILMALGESFETSQKRATFARMYFCTSSSALKSMIPRTRRPCPG